MVGGLAESGRGKSAGQEVDLIEVGKVAIEDNVVIHCVERGILNDDCVGVDVEGSCVDEEFAHIHVQVSSQ